MWQSLPEFGTGVLYTILVTAAYTFAVGLAAGRGQPRLLRSARLGAYATAGLTLFAIALLAYAFVTHDFRIRYVAHYSDRSMPKIYLFTALWGGQDGSLLWWLFLLSGYTTACVAWLGGRYRHLQPYVIATLMAIFGFFVVLMLFAANPFEATIAGAHADGEGLNPLLQNYWMIIHPPSLYTGFVGCSVPFAFCVAALASGRLDNEWIVAVRKWMLFAFMFLSIGNVLGMAWAYEELGWGGYWAWDPVENAACLPWFSAAAYVHSTMIQERRNMLKVWNVVLICVTFFLTIFGTFLTRAGIISSVHAFAQSDIGKYFVGFMGLVAATSAALIVWRLPKLRGKSEIEAVASREAMFVINNWALLGGATFILVATLFPKLSELWHDKVTVGPPFFNRWMAPIGLTIFALMGLAPLFGWRKTSPDGLKKAFRFPGIVLVSTYVLHVAFGRALGYPAFVERDVFYPGIVGVVLQKIGSALPGITVAIAAFNVAVVIQEFARGIAARQRSAEKRNETESIPVALLRLLDKNRRRYGGYIVHLGICAMFIGFTGGAWGLDRETAMMPGQTYKLGHYDLRYDGPRMCPGNPRCSPEEQADVSKRMIFADLTLFRNGVELGRLSPAKFIYHRQPDSPTTEVSMRRSLSEDVYTVLGMVDPQSKRATFQLHLNVLVSWIWVGVMVLVSGTLISLWPELSFREVGAWSYLRASAGASAGISTSIILALWLAMSPTSAYAAAPRPQPPALVSDVKRPFPVAPLGASVAGLGFGAIVAFGRRRSR
jgi:cytochrome c-type biogenesis protein CcmF